MMQHIQMRHRKRCGLVCVTTCQGRRALPFRVAAGLLAALLWTLLFPLQFEARVWAAPLLQSEATQELYAERCAACHGIDGDGQGPAAERLFIKPRDFTRDEYKIKSTQGDEFPSREDLTRVIAEGMPGSTMPAWEGVLTEAQIGDLADYIQTFGRFFSDDGYGTTVIDVPARVSANEESIARGRQLFESDIECIKCHGEAGRGDGPSAFEQFDSAGHVIYPADLTQPWRFRGGGEPEDVYLRLRTGLLGSPMPSFADALSEEETWDLVNYVLSLSPTSAPEPAIFLVSHFVNGPLPDDPNDTAWTDIEPAYYPLSGQLMRAPRHYRPSVDAVWVRSLYNDAEIAFQISWNDRTETRSGEVVDAVAIQFPQELSEDDQRPYFLFGEPTHPVYQIYWSGETDAVLERNARGLDAVAEQAAERQQVEGQVSFEHGRWQMMTRRPLLSEDANDLSFEIDRFIPLAFMVWDGNEGESGPLMGLTTWSTVYLQSDTATIQYAWVPGVAIAVVLAELGVVWLARRRPSDIDQE